MIKISHIHIKRFRSILNLQMNVSDDTNIITICGENNVGKTNTLRAINLFFNPQLYDPKADAPHHKFEATRGGAVYPEIKISFVDKEKTYIICRYFNNEGLRTTKGWERNGALLQEMTQQNIDFFFSQVIALFADSHNIDFPNLINGLVENIYDIEFARTRFSGLKKDLKEAYDNYTQGLIHVLNELGQEIDPAFKEFNPAWGVSFNLETDDVKKFRDLISDEINFYIQDGSKRNIEAKGAGLQHLAYLLLYCRIIEKIKNLSVFFLIDEPNAFLHYGLEKKLKIQLVKCSDKAQLFVTTHSPVFIDSFTLKNVFLMELKITDRYFVRKNKSYSILDTSIVECGELDGAKKIRTYLGIPTKDADVLDKYTLLVEGESDKVYIENLLSYFNLSGPEIRSVAGVDNMQKVLNYYNALYAKREMKPCILALFDNDQAGRDAYMKVSRITYSNINVKLLFTPTVLGETPNVDNLYAERANYEIEDFMYPSVVCYIANQILAQAEYAVVDERIISSKSQLPAHKLGGILALIENEKNNVNPMNGQNILISGNNFKESMARKFQVQANAPLIHLLDQESKKYPQVKMFMNQIANVPLLFKSG